MARIAQAWSAALAALRELGAAGFVLHVLDRCLRLVSGGRWKLFSVRFFAIAVPEAAGTDLSGPRQISAVQVARGDVAEEAFGRPPGVVEKRFDEGSLCVAARTAGGDLAGFMWLHLGPLRERLVRCEFEPVPACATSWDYDLFVTPRYRLGRTFARLWECAFSVLRSHGVRATISWVAFGNPASTRAHERMGGLRVGWAVFFVGAKAQVTVASVAPFVHVSLAESNSCRLRVSAHRVLGGGPKAGGQQARRGASAAAVSIDSVPQTASEPPRAVVIGLCGHGLAVARALVHAGVQVTAIDADDTLPGWKSRLVDRIRIPDINGPALVDSLLQLRPSLGVATPVLFLTNDRMVCSIAERAHELTGRYQLSWADSAPWVLRLQDKINLRARCKAIGMAYPEERVIDRVDAAAAQCAGLRYPVILKPARPLSGFKTLIVEHHDQIEAACVSVASSLPVLAQEFVPGGDELIHFGVLYLVRGRPIARFEGRKLRSRPMGHTTVAVSCPSDEIHEATCRFFAGLEMSGPVSLEIKRGPDGRLWVIEPTVGRTDFWLDVCTINGVNLPLVEFCDQAGFGERITRQGDRGVWVNEERDPLSWGWLVARYPAIALGRVASFVYLQPRDPGPFLRVVGNWMARLPRRVFWRFRGLLTGR